MDQQYNYYEEQPKKKGHIITGLIGALLGALVGAAVWAGAAIFLDIIAGIIGFLIGFLASKGYDLLKGRQGWAKLVCVIIAVIFGVVVGTGAAYAWLLHDDYNNQLAELTEIQRHLYELMPEYEIMTEKEFFIDNITNNPDFMAEVYKTLGLGLLFAALGCFDLLKSIAAKPAASPAASAQSIEQAQPDQDSDDFSAEA